MRVRFATVVKIESLGLAVGPDVRSVAPFVPLRRRSVSSVVRPKKPASQRKETVIAIRVTDADKPRFRDRCGVQLDRLLDGYDRHCLFARLRNRADVGAQSGRGFPPPGRGRFDREAESSRHQCGWVVWGALTLWCKLRCSSPLSASPTRYVASISFALHIVSSLPGRDNMGRDLRGSRIPSPLRIDHFS